MSFQIDLTGKKLEVIGCRWKATWTDNSVYVRKEFCTNCYFSADEKCREYRERHNAKYIFVEA